MTPRTGRPKLPDDEKRVKDTFSMTAGERSLVEEAIEKEGSKESVRLWIVRKALELARKIIKK